MSLLLVENPISGILPCVPGCTDYDRGVRGLIRTLGASTGLTVTRMATQGWLTSSTAYLEFDDVKVLFVNSQP